MSKEKLPDNDDPLVNAPDWVTQEFPGEEDLGGGEGLSAERKIKAVGRFFEDLTENLIGGIRMPHSARIGDIYHPGMQAIIEVKGVRNLGIFLIPLVQIRRYKRYLRKPDDFRENARKSGCKESLGQAKRCLFFLFDYVPPGGNRSQLAHVGEDKIPDILHRTAKRLYIVDMGILEKLTANLSATRMVKNLDNKTNTKKIFVSKLVLNKLIRQLVRSRELAEKDGLNKVQTKIKRDLDEKLGFLRPSKSGPLPSAYVLKASDWDDWDKFRQESERVFSDQSEQESDLKWNELQIAIIAPGEESLDIMTEIQQRTNLRELPSRNRQRKRSRK